MDPSGAQRVQSNTQDARFHYPQYRNQPQQQSQERPEPSPYAQPSQYSQFPPHPSVRPPPGAKLSARQVPLGVGVAPPPVRPQERQQPRPSNSGVLIQDFRFPPAPPAPASRSRQDQGGQPFPGRNNMHESYMSSVLDDFTPGTTPGSRSRGFPTPRGRYSGSVYAESEALGMDERYLQGRYSPEITRPSSPDSSPQIVRQASVGKRAKPAVTTIKSRTSHLEQDIPEEVSTRTPASKNAAMAALSAAIAAGTGSKPIDFNDSAQGSRSYTPVRMPFDGSPPPSPSQDREYLRTPKSATTFASGHILAQSTSHGESLPSTGHSRKSTNPLLGLGIDQPAAMSNKIPASKRPPKLDMDAVREAEARGSTTSLADLIKRATKLAANLDRGKTASRLGMLDMFGSQEKLAGNNRHSTMSDMISAFPAPAIGGTPTNRRDADWPLSEKGDPYASTTELSKTKARKQRRKFCGLSLPVFIAVLTIVVVLIAAAVLIPIFLILVPKQNRNNSNALTNCAANFPCENGGTSIVSDDRCMCICSDGFTGSQCATSGNTKDCITMTLTEGSNEYENATIGRSVMPVLSPQNRFDVPLNISTILGVFSSNNLSCSSENSLVDFNSSALNSGNNKKRFIILPEFESPDSTVQPLIIHAVPAVPQITNPAACTGDVRLERRQDGVTVGTSNGIVFQATTSTVDSGPSEPAGTGGPTTSNTVPTASESTSESSSTTSSSGSKSTSTAAPSSKMTDKEIEFAQVVVMYILQESRSVSVAVNTQQQIEMLFSQSDGEGSNVRNNSVEVGSGDLQLFASFEDFTISYGNSTVTTVVGGGK
ncbi:uncharacterized protein A1O9_12785 [Exophiala aquamarina CBS 119918]|uniref:EGF-like domain-containing protein n=1 Tax=Exophiala aquamarina CBS 119918 TaxID=1182545 RepID=A0A072NU65_9EURO|nr:uncharacterized protein A1O9_12785 [Exophiala aquamarina CBS 119918]KEF51171.1 hypothetical protein A1O9_12785 [Exophiala aquamarina CBS 119918]